MAKEKKVEKKAAKVEKKAEAETFKYGVSDLADKLGIEAATVRVRLRNANVAKAGKSYGWNTKSDLEDVIAEIQAEKPAKKAKADKAPKKADKADKKAGKDKPAKKAKKVADEDEDD